MGFLGFLYKVSLVCAVAAHGADLAETENCIGAGKCREMNPWLVRFEQPATFGAAKMGVAAGSLILTDKVWQQESKKLKIAAVSANFAQCGAYAYVAKRNADVAAGRRR
jgi:hypothetical protein